MTIAAKLTMSKIHIDRGGQRFGPYTETETRQYLANGQLLQSDLAWKEGMEDWVPLTMLLDMGITSTAIPPKPHAPKRELFRPVAAIGILAITGIAVWQFWPENIIDDHNGGRITQKEGKGSSGNGDSSGAGANNASGTQLSDEGKVSPPAGKTLGFLKTKINVGGHGPQSLTMVTKGGAFFVTGKTRVTGMSGSGQVFSERGGLEIINPHVVIGPDDVVIIAAGRKIITQLWQYPLPQPNSASVALGPDGTIIGGTAIGTVLFLNKNGSLIRTVPLGGTINATPVIGHLSGQPPKVYISSNRGLTALNYQTGAKLWQNAQVLTRSQPALGADGTIFTTSIEGVVAVNTQDGMMKWTFSHAAAREWTCPVIGMDGTVYIGSIEGSTPFRVFALDENNGEKRWEFTGEKPRNFQGAPHGQSPPAPTVGADGTVYIGSPEGKLYALNGQTGVKRWELEAESPITTSPIIDKDGTLWLHAGNSLMSIVTDSAGYAESSWPMQGQNPQRTGCLNK